MATTPDVGTPPQEFNSNAIAKIQSIIFMYNSYANALFHASN